MNKDYREIYKGVEGACASCVNARSKVWELSRTNSERTEARLVPYDGGKEVYCAIDKLSVLGALVADVPDDKADIEPCWEGGEKNENKSN